MDHFQFGYRTQTRVRLLLILLLMLLDLRCLYLPVVESYECSDPSHTHRCAVAADIAAAAAGLTVSVPASCWIVGKGLRSSYGEGCLVGFTCVVVAQVMLYYFCCCCCSLIYVDVVVVRTIFCSLNISTSPRVFSRVFSHTAQAVFYRCPLSISLLLTVKASSQPCSIPKCQLTYFNVNHYITHEISKHLCKTRPSIWV